MMKDKEHEKEVWVSCAAERGPTFTLETLRFMICAEKKTPTPLTRPEQGEEVRKISS